jgi:hypothetical protein
LVGTVINAGMIGVMKTLSNALQIIIFIDNR